MRHCFLLYLQAVLRAMHTAGELRQHYVPDVGVDAVAPATFLQLTGDVMVTILQALVEGKKIADLISAQQLIRSTEEAMQAEAEGLQGGATQAEGGQAGAEADANEAAVAAEMTEALLEFSNDDYQPGDQVAIMSANPDYLQDGGAPLQIIAMGEVMDDSDHTCFTYRTFEVSVYVVAF